MERLSELRNRTVLPLCVCLLLAVAPVALPQASPAVEHAMALMRAGDNAGAAKLLTARLAGAPADLDARLLLGDIYARQGQTEAAEREYREALRLHPTTPTAAFALGAFYNSAGKADAAEPLLRDAVRRNPRLEGAAFEWALSLARLRKYRAAATALAQAPPPADGPARIRYLRLSASVHSGLGEPVAAAREMEQALRIAPADDGLRLAAAVAEAEAGDWKNCILNAEPLYAKNPNAAIGLVLVRAQLATGASPAATLRALRDMALPDEQALALRLQLAGTLAAAGAHDEAVKDYEAASRLGSQRTEILYDLAVEQYRSRQFDAALATVTSLKARATSAELEDLAGDIEEARGNYLNAVHCYQQAVALAPREEKYRMSLGLELIRHQSFEPALTVFRQAAELFPRSERIQIGLAVSAHLLERRSDSVAAFLKAMDLDPGSSRPVRYLGITESDRPDGPDQAAVKAVCRRADANAKDPSAATWCGALLFRQAYAAGNESAAPASISRLRTAVTLAPADPDAVCHLGRALAWAGKDTDARTALENCIRLRPDSAEDHYRLGRIYQQLGLTEAASEQMAVHGRLSRQSQEASEQQRSAMKQFVYEILEPAAKAPAR